jgi:hypothetical protein
VIMLLFWCFVLLQSETGWTRFEFDLHKWKFNASPSSVAYSLLNLENARWKNKFSKQLVAEDYFILKQMLRIAQN